MMPCHSLPSIQSADLTRILMTTAASRRSGRLGRTELQRKRKVSRKLSHQLSVDSDIMVAGQDLHERVKEDKNLIKTCTYLGKCYPSSFKGEDLLHWMVSRCWAAHAKEAMSISQLLLTHNVIVNVSDTRSLMTFKKFAIFRFRSDQEGIPVEPTSDCMDASLDMLYRRLWSDWVIRSRVLGWWLYTNTVTGEEFVSWLTTTAQLTASREEARHFADQLLLVNFLIRIYPPVAREDRTSGLHEDKREEFFDDGGTIYQVNVCCNQSVDVTTKVCHTLAHAVRLCSVDSEECMFYGKSDVEEDVILEQFEMEETSPLQSLQSTTTETSLSGCEDTKRFLQSVCRAYYPEFTSAIEDTYYSYELDPDASELVDFTIPDEMFHSFQLSTFDLEDSIVIELEDGVDLEDLDHQGRRTSCVEEPSQLKGRACTLDLMPTPQDPSFLFQNSRLEISFEDIPTD